MADGKMGGDQVFLLVDGRNVRLLNFLANNLRCSSHISSDARSEGWTWNAATYWDAVCVLLADTFSLCLTLLERVLVLELGAHDV